MPPICGAFLGFCRLCVPLLFVSVTLAGFLPHHTLCLFGVSLVAAIGCFPRLSRLGVIKFSFFDITVILFGTQILLSGVLGFGGTDALLGSVVSFVLLMTVFLISVTVDDDDRERAVSALIVSSAVSAVVGVWQIFYGGYESGWLDSSAFSGISVRITSVFGNPNVYSAYLLLVIPFVIYRAINAVGLKKKLWYYFLLAWLLLCMVETWSRGAWLGLMLELVVFAAFYKKRLIPYAVISLPTLAAAVSFFSPNVWTRLISIGDLSDTSVSYRISAWKGILKMVCANNFIGIGYGEPAFVAVYPLFAYSGATAVKHSHSLYLQILIELGAVGLILFVTVMLALFKGVLFNWREKVQDRGISIAGMSALLGVLFMGFTDHIWYDTRIFMLFWLVVALCGRETVNDS